MKNSKKEKEKEKKESPLRKRIDLLISIFFMIFVLTVIGLVIFTCHLLCRSDYFLIKESRIDWLRQPLAKRPYQELTGTGVGQNIFKFGISSAADEILTGHPELKDMRIRRDFPDRLTLQVNPRVPVAQVGEISFFLIDQEGVVLTKARNSIREGLPIITGVGWRPFRRIGQKEGTSRMVKALTLLEVINESNFLNDHTLIKIDTSDSRNISFLIEDGLEVKIGHSNFKERLKLLEKTLQSMAVDKDEIRYIDLRFDDAVLGTK